MLAQNDNAQVKRAIHSQKWTFTHTIFLLLTFGNVRSTVWSMVASFHVKFILKCSGSEHSISESVWMWLSFHKTQTWKTNGCILFWFKREWAWAWACQYGQYEASLDKSGSVIVVRSFKFITEVMGMGYTYDTVIFSSSYAATNRLANNFANCFVKTSNLMDEK